MRLFSVILFCLALLGVLGASALPSTVPDAGVPTMPASEVKRGMRGYGLTVFEGTKIERFEVEILGVLYNFGARTDRILARLSGGPLEETGPIGGMSGSPVYIDGKLIGAVSSTFGFVKSPTVFITPIAEMLDVFSFEGRAADRPFRMEKATNSEMHGRFFASGPHGQEGRAHTMHPIASPLIISGIHPEVFPMLAQTFEKSGFIPIQGGGAGTHIEAAQSNLKLEPGSAVGVQLVGGDINMTSIGTVTWVGKGKDANAVLAFGHPVTMRGGASFPMTTAWIHSVISSYQLSVKLGSALTAVGVIQQDRSAALGGRVGIEANTIPVSLSFTMGERKRDYRLTIIRDHSLFANLFVSTVQSVLLENSAPHGAVTCVLEYAFTLRDVQSGRRETIRFKNGYAGFMSSAAWQASALAVIASINEAVFSGRVDVAIDDVSVTITARPEINAVEITGLSADRKTVRPGDTVNLTVELTPWRGQPFTERVSIKVPENTLNARIIFVASNTANERYFDRSFGEAKYEHHSFDSLVRSLSISHDPSELAIWTELAQRGIVIGDEHLPNLPDSRFAMLARSGTPRMGVFNSRLRSLNPTTHLLYGLQYVILDMKYEH